MQRWTAVLPNITLLSPSKISTAGDYILDGVNSGFLPECSFPVNDY